LSDSPASSCERCGRANAADARFCGGCGAPLPTGCVQEGRERPEPAGFIGREPELATLLKMLARARAGRGATVALAGEPGIGKTHTAQVAGEHAASSGMQVLWAHCNEEPGAPPYWPWLQLVRGWLAAHDDAAVQRVLGHAASPLAEIVPEIAQRAPGCEPPPPIADPQQARFRLFDAMSGFWRRACAEQPHLLILDNLHWADASSLRLLEFLAPDLASCPILVAITYRDIELSRQHPLSGTLGELARQPGFQRLRLLGLSRAETARMIALAAGADVPAAVADTLHEQTEGNPLFVGEMTRLLVQEGLLGAAPATQRIPEGIKEVIGRRLNRLANATNQVLASAAMIGRSFEARLLLRVMEEPDEEACARALEEALQAHVIESLPGAGQYRFAHALFRETLYEEIPPPRRSRLHLKVVQALERIHDGDVDAHLPALAYHAWAALPGGDAARAVEYARRAAEQADAVFAHEEAARSYRLALEALDAGAAADRALRCHLLNAIAEAQTRAGDYLLAQESFHEAAQLARRQHLPAELARAALGLETATWRPGMPGIAAARLLREALDATGTADRTLAARLLSALGRALIFSGEEGQAMKVYEQAVATARESGDAAVLGSTLASTLTARWQHDRIAERLANADEAAQLATSTGNRALMFEACAWRMFDSFELGDMAAWREQVAQYERGAEERREPFLRYVAASSRTMHALMEGRFAEAEQLARRTLEIGRRMPGLDAVGVYGVQMFTLRREQGRLDEVAPLVRHFVAGPGGAEVWRPGLALIYAELGDLGAAREQFKLLAADGFASLVRDGVWVASVTYFAHVATALGDAPRAELLYRLLAPYAGRNLLAGTSIACFGAADAVLGSLSATLRRWDEAQRHFEAALGMNERQGARPALAHTRQQYAQMLLARASGDDRALATALLDAAAADAAVLGMRTLARRIERCRAALATSPAPKRYPAGLSEREAQVLAFVAAGKSNRDIARQLFLSPNTVANHVRSILVKTQSGNRTEAAAFAIRHRIVRDERSLRP
jgi:predicted ATPase/DNA-binding CsgD family transcriptional regulator